MSGWSQARLNPSAPLPKKSGSMSATSAIFSAVRSLPLTLSMPSWRDASRWIWHSKSYSTGCPWSGLSNDARFRSVANISSQKCALALQSTYKYLAILGFNWAAIEKLAVSSSARICMASASGWSLASVCPCQEKVLL